MERKDLEDNGRKFLQILFPSLLHVCIEIVAENLDNKDIRNLIAAFNFTR